MGADDVREFLERGRSTQQAVDARILEAVVRQSGNPTAAAALARLERIEAIGHMVLRALDGSRVSAVMTQALADALGKLRKALG